MGRNVNATLVWSPCRALNQQNRRKDLHRDRQEFPDSSYTLLDFHCICRSEKWLPPLRRDRDLIVRPCCGLPVPGRRLSPTYASDNCVLLTFAGNRTYMYIGPSQLLEPECGTVCRQTWDNRNCHTASSGGQSLKTFFISLVRPRRSVNSFNCAV